ncbi:MAG: hypothetical protein J5I90_06525 [Caldilineales bacterium]|nr:hypothetical protein [Caldilineales bacterium]
MAQAGSGGNGQNKADTRQDRKFLEIKKAGCKLGLKYPLEVNARMFPPPLEIGDEEGFTPEKDIFGRKNLGMGLVNLLANLADPIVLALDGQWGAGQPRTLRQISGPSRLLGLPKSSGKFRSFSH